MNWSHTAMPTASHTAAGRKDIKMHTCCAGHALSCCHCQRLTIGTGLAMAGVLQLLQAAVQLLYQI
jgi:hypothetical protein